MLPSSPRNVYRTPRRPWTSGSPTSRGWRTAAAPVDLQQRRAALRQGHPLVHLAAGLGPAVAAAPGRVAVPPGVRVVAGQQPVRPEDQQGLGPRDREQPVLAVQEQRAVAQRLAQRRRGPSGVPHQRPVARRAALLLQLHVHPVRRFVHGQPVLRHVLRVEPREAAQQCHVVRQHDRRKWPAGVRTPLPEAHPRVWHGLGDIVGSAGATDCALGDPRGPGRVTAPGVTRPCSTGRVAWGRLVPWTRRRCGSAG